MNYSKTHKGQAWKQDKEAHLTFGNTKMSIPLFSLPAIETCIGSTPLCRKYCYAKRPQLMFPALRAKRKKNLALSKTDKFVDVISKEIASIEFIPFFRIHESGEFYNQEYLNKWFEICKRFPERKFLAFTKAFQLDFSKRPKNLSIYFSIWADTDTSLFRNRKIKKAITVIDYKWAKKDGLNKAISTKHAIKCKGHCDKCLICFNNESNIFFPVH